MVQQFSWTATLWRWLVAGVLLATSEGRLLALAGGASLIGFEVYLRMTRKTLRLDQGRVEVWTRGARVSWCDEREVRYASWLSRFRSMVASLLLSVLLAGAGWLVWATGDAGTGVGLILLGLGSIAASIWDFKMLWLMEVPKAGGGSWSMLLRKSDVVALLGFWPADER